MPSQLVRTSVHPQGPPRPLGRPRPVAILAALLAATLAWASAPSPASAKTIATEKKRGVTVRLEAADAKTDDGKAAVDLSASVVGPGTKDATVVFWIRPKGRPTFGAPSEGGSADGYHAIVPVAGRGSSDDWEISALANLKNGRQVQASNVSPTRAPGPRVSRESGKSAPLTAPKSAVTSTGSPAERADDGGSSGLTIAIVIALLVVLLIAGGFFLSSRRGTGAQGDA